MSSSTQNPISFTSRDQTGWSLLSLESEAEMEKLDREADHDYLPMDVFVDLRTRKQHFQESSVRARWTKIHPSAAH
jgi:hypothetical protein